LLRGAASEIASRPLVARNTGVVVGDGFNGDDAARNTFHTTQRYQYYPGDIETYAENQTEDTRSRNVNVELHYSNGGNFSAELRGIYADAKQLHMQSYAQFAVSDGNLWPNEPIDAAPPGQMVYPGGNRVFDPFGFAPGKQGRLVSWGQQNHRYGSFGHL